jgi:transcriptional regulator with XRE-family HTH domain
MQALCSVSANCPYAVGMQTGRPSKRPRPPFGERLHALREEAGLTQAQVASKLGITQRAYAFWEREPTAVRAEQLAILTELFGVTADFLIGRQPPKQRGAGPTGKTRRVFEAVSKLPRHHQQKIVDVVETFVAGHQNGNGRTNGNS